MEGDPYQHPRGKGATEVGRRTLEQQQIAWRRQWALGPLELIEVDPPEAAMGSGEASEQGKQAKGPNDALSSSPGRHNRDRCRQAPVQNLPRSSPQED